MSTPRSRAPRRHKLRGWLIGVVVIAALLAVPFVSQVVVATQNDAIAESVENDLVALPLPADTQLVDSYSSAGKLVGNGNGMQYLGVLIIESDLSTAELTSYYADQAHNLDESRTSEYPTTIDVEQGDSTQLHDIGRMSDFLAEASQPHRFVVFMWGNAPSEWHEDWDLRGH